MLNCQRIEAHLYQLAQPIERSLILNFQCHGFDQLASTNVTVWDLLSHGAREGTVAISAYQTAGRGQWGRQWQSERGGVYLSLALCPHLSSHDAPQLTISAGWGIAYSLQQQGIPAQLKWPNDLILMGHKLGGILTETRVTHQIIDRAVVGVGLNGFNPVPETGINLQSYLEGHPLLEGDRSFIVHNQDLDLEAIAAIILHGLNLGYSRLKQDGIDALLIDYEAMLIHGGHKVI